MDWRDQNNPVKRGESFAERILSAPHGATVTIRGRKAYESAIRLTEFRRPDDELGFLYVPLSRAAGEMWMAVDPDSLQERQQ